MRNATKNSLSSHEQESLNVDRRQQSELPQTRRVYRPHHSLSCYPRTGSKRPRDTESVRPDTCLNLLPRHGMRDRVAEAGSRRKCAYGSVASAVAEVIKEDDVLRVLMDQLIEGTARGRRPQGTEPAIWLVSARYRESCLAAAGP